MKKDIYRSLILCVFIMTLNAQEFSFSKRETDSLVSFNFINNTYAPITLAIERLSDLNIGLPDSPTVCNPNDSLIGIIKIPKAYIDENPDFDTSKHFKSSVTFGKQLDEDDITPFLYELPFKKGKKYKIIQGFYGKFTHFSDQSRYAIDFKMPIGDTIVAARKGYVVRVVEKFTEHGGKAFRSKANQVLIYHDDGTIAYYVHLDKDGALVDVGDFVEAGQSIGISGFTGYTTRPHLHFVVRNFKHAIPIQFRQKKGIGERSGVSIRKKD